MTRLLVSATFVLVACSPPPPTTVYVDLPRSMPSYYNAHTDTVYLDLGDLAWWDTVYPGSAEWIPAHEEGHRQTLRSTLDVGAVGLVRLERLAQCWAEAELGHGPPWVDDDAGYWDCDDAMVAEL